MKLQKHSKIVQGEQKLLKTGKPCEAVRAGKNINKKMENLKKVFLGAAIVAVSMVFVGCDKEDDDIPDTSGGSVFVIQANVVNGNAYNNTIDVVKFFGGDETTNEVASGNYTNGGFTLTPSPSKYFQGKMSDLMEEGMLVSDLNAKICVSDDIDIYAYKNGVEIGKFDYHDENNENNDAGLWYVDRDVNITGYVSEKDYDWTTEFNLSLKKGWNMVFYVHSGSVSNKTYITTKEPSGFKWYFYSYSD